MKPEPKTLSRPNFIVLAALILNTLICGEYAISMGLNIFGNNAYYRPLSFGLITLPSIFNHIDLLWPIGAAIFSAVGLIMARWFRALGILFGLSFALFMSAVMIYFYSYSLEYDPNRMGGMIEDALVWTALFAINCFAAIRAIKSRQA